MPQDASDAAARWWRTSIIDIQPGVIRTRGYPIEQLIGAITFPAMIWLMIRGDLPTPAEADLLGAALVASVDHGPQAPSIATARMAITCGVGINNAMASGVNALGDIHGGAGQQCMELYAAIAARMANGAPLAEAVEIELTDQLAAGEMIAGFGHRFHPTDPRAAPILDLAERARAAGVIGGATIEIGRMVEATLAKLKGRRLPMNIDGVTAIVFAELGFEPPLGRGLFILSRSVGILAHAWEQQQQGARIKGPMPPSINFTYEGPAPRVFEGGE
jgi:citrate synthase